MYEIPANPADSGILKLSAVDSSGASRVLQWHVEPGQNGAWYTQSLRDGTRSKSGFNWNGVLLHFTNVRPYVDPVQQAVTDAVTEVQVALRALVEAYAQGSADRAMAGARLADELTLYVESLGKITE